MDILALQHLKKYFATQKAVDDISMAIPKGDIFGLLGPNGAGKTTTFYITVGLVEPNKGNVFLDNQNISKVPMYKRAQLGVGYLPQENSVFRTLSVEDNIRAILEFTPLTKTQQREKLELLIGYALCVQMLMKLK